MIGMELCGSHGCALVKGRSTEGKHRAVGLNSLTRMLRDNRTLNVLGQFVTTSIEPTDVHIVHGFRPHWHQTWADTLMKQVFDGEDEHFYTVHKSGHRT